MKMIVGLGNPGKEYEKTRHNVGFSVLDFFANSHSFSISKEKFNGLYEIVNFKNETVLFLKPLSYMNLSGEVIRKFVDYYKISLDDILIIHDDLDLDLGCYRLRYKGSSGGHNGLKNIELHLNSNNYKRLKVGISNNRMLDTKDYVLQKFSLEEFDVLKALFPIFEKLICDFLIFPFDVLMNCYNKK